MIIEAILATTEIRLFEGSESTEAISFGGVSTPLIWTTKKLSRDVEYVWAIDMSVEFVVYEHGNRTYL